MSPRRLLAHIAMLRASGLTLQTIAAQAGVGVSTLHRARRPGAKVSIIVERSVLGVAP